MRRREKAGMNIIFKTSLKFALKYWAERERQKWEGEKKVPINPLMYEKSKRVKFGEGMPIIGVKIGKAIPT